MIVAISAVGTFILRNSFTNRAWSSVRPLLDVGWGGGVSSTSFELDWDSEVTTMSGGFETKRGDSDDFETVVADGAESESRWLLVDDAEFMCVAAAETGVYV
jgi:hypothetical protein